LRSTAAGTFRSGRRSGKVFGQTRRKYDQRGRRRRRTSSPALLDGRYDIALAGIDNLVAYQEGQGRSEDSRQPDLFAFLGNDSGFASIPSAPAVRSFADLKGKTVSVDAMTTGYAFVVRDILARNGIAEADVTYVRAGGTANRYRDLLAGGVPRSCGRAVRAPGARAPNVLATAEALGAYQGTTGIARRSWRQRTRRELIGFIRGYRAGIDWLYDRANRDVVEAIPDRQHPGRRRRSRGSRTTCCLPIRVASRDAALDMDGIRTVLALRSNAASARR
jgi:ABC-type nitrate/sulfonate/bicarbonate transport system substrate-binding protein